MPKQDEQFVELRDVSDDDMVVDLTVGQFKEMISFNQRFKQLKALEEHRQEEIKNLQRLQDSSKNLFADSEKLSAVTTPFRLATEKDVKEFVGTLKAAIDAKQVVIIVMAIEGS